MKYYFSISFTAFYDLPLKNGGFIPKVSMQKGEMGKAKNKRNLLKADLNAVPGELWYLLIFFNFGFNKGKEGVWISDAGMGPKNILRIRKLFQTQSISITMTALRHPHLLSVQITPKCVSNGLSGEILDTTTQKRTFWQ